MCVTAVVRFLRQSRCAVRRPSYVGLGRLMAHALRRRVRGWRQCCPSGEIVGGRCLFAMDICYLCNGMPFSATMLNIIKVKLCRFSVSGMIFAGVV